MDSRLTMRAKLIPYSVILGKIATKNSTINPVILKLLLKFHNDTALSLNIFIYIQHSAIYLFCDKKKLIIILNILIIRLLM